MTFNDYITEVAGWLVAFLVVLGVLASVFLFVWSKDLLGLGNTVLLALGVLHLILMFGLLSAYITAKLP
jgi:hypothetical protein